MLPFLGVIKLWQKFIAPGLAPRCKYYPSCSHYTYEAIKRYNIIGIFVPETLKIKRFTLINQRTEGAR
jgi:putative component of membrane protein insertase Oxa1/YidC/SpoIIIJ protein YidD